MEDLALRAARTMGVDPERVNVVREPMWSWRKMGHVDRVWLEVQGITREEHDRHRAAVLDMRCLLMPHDSGYLGSPRPPNHLRRWRLSPDAYPEVERRAWARVRRLLRDKVFHLR